MSQFPQNVSTPTAVSKYSQLNLSNQHLTSFNFMDFTVSLGMELVPKQKVDVEHILQTRADALFLPTYGQAKIHNRVFFVPYRTVFPAWDDFFNDVAHTYTNGTTAHITNVPTIANSVLLGFLRSTICSELPMQNPNVENVTLYFNLPEARNANADFVVRALASNEVSSRDFQCYRLNVFGKRVLRLLLSLGYGINFDATAPDEKHSALPLLTLCKLYYDWYYPQSYVQDVEAQAIVRLFNYDNPNFTINLVDIQAIFKMIERVNYRSDKYTSIWDNPVGPTDGSYSNFKISDPQYGDNVSVYNYNTSHSTPVLRSVDLVSTSTDQNVITQYSLTALKALNDYMHRHSIAGARVIDRALAQFGVTLSAEKLKRSVWITDYHGNFNIGDVTSTADTEEAPLGSYAGKAFGSADGSFGYYTDEFGMLFVITTVVPVINYYQGFNRHTKALTKLDFYNPELDALGVQAISKGEVYCPLNIADAFKVEEGVVSPLSDEQINYNGVFGFKPRYAHYKEGRDLITGDYRLGSLNADMHAWYLFRDLTPYFAGVGVNDAYHDRDFLLANDSEQYNRIFNAMKDNSTDHLYVNHYFNIKSTFPGSKLFDDYEYETDGKADEVNIQLNGTKAD